MRGRLFCLPFKVTGSVSAWGRLCGGLLLTTSYLLTSTASWSVLFAGPSLCSVLKGTRYVSHDPSVQNTKKASTAAFT